MRTPVRARSPGVGIIGSETLEPRVAGCWPPLDGAARRPRMSEPKRGWFQRLSEGLSRSSRQMTEQVTGALTKRPLDQSQLDALEEMLIEADLGPAAAARITESFAEARFGRQVDETEVKEALAAAVARELVPRQGDFD